MIASLKYKCLYFLKISHHVLNNGDIPKSFSGKSFRLHCLLAGNALKHGDREKHFDEFMNWLHENNVDTTCVTLGQFDEGYGLKANKHVEVLKLP